MRFYAFGNLHAEGDESVIANEEGKNFGSIDQNVEVVDQGFAVEKVVRRDQKIPASLKALFDTIRICSEIFSMR